MLKVFQLHVSIATFAGMVADGLLCFFAVLLAASSLQLGPGTASQAALTTPHMGERLDLSAPHLATRWWREAEAATVLASLPDHGSEPAL